MATTTQAWATGKQEWLNYNRSRAYPLADTTGGVPGTLPGSLLVDAAIFSDTPNITEVYISKVEVSDLGWMISLTVTYGKETQNTTILDRVISVSYSSAPNSVAKFIRSSGDLCLAGAFTIGDPTAIKDWPSTTILTKEQGLLPAHIVHDISGLFLTGIRVGDTLLTGEVTLIAGDGIDFDLGKDGKGNTLLTIKNTRYTIPNDNMDITTDAELLEQLGNTYGRPVTTINGVKPDKDGNIVIATPISEDPNTHYIIPKDTATGTLSLTIKKDPCLDFDTIDNLAANLEQLNIRGVRLDEGVKALDRGLNSIATQMTRLDK